MRWKKSLITRAGACKNRQDIQKNCQDFAQYCGFKHFFILGSFFDDYSTPYTRALTNYCDTGRYRHAPYIHDLLNEIIDHSLVSATPFIRGKLKIAKPASRKILTGITHIDKRDHHSSINFPIHFPSGRFALLHIGTHSNQKVNYESTLTYGYQFALAICSSFFKLIENPFPEVYLTDREHSCLTLAGDGINPRLASLQLGISVHTVQHHLKMARKKMLGKNLQQALSHALNQGMISPEAEYPTGLIKTATHNL